MAFYCESGKIDALYHSSNTVPSSINKKERKKDLKYCGIKVVHRAKAG